MIEERKKKQKDPSTRHCARHRPDPSRHPKAKAGEGEIVIKHQDRDVAQSIVEKQTASCQSCQSGAGEAEARGQRYIGSASEVVPGSVHSMMYGYRVIVPS